MWLAASSEKIRKRRRRPWLKQWTSFRPMMPVASLGPLAGGKMSTTQRCDKDGPLKMHHEGEKTITRKETHHRATQKLANNTFLARLPFGWLHSQKSATISFRWNISQVCEIQQRSVISAFRDPLSGMLLNSLCILETEVGLTATSRKSVAILNERDLHKGYKDPWPNSHWSPVIGYGHTSIQ